MPAVVSENALKILDKRYFDKTVGEDSPEKMWKRCSGGNKEYEEMLSELLFLPNSPTLFNLGTKNGGTLSACFVFDFDDTLRDGPRSIMATIDKAAAVAKAGGGVGYYGGNLRGKGSVVHSTHRYACGPVEVMRFCNRLAKLITQGGKRDLAQMFVLNVDHPDIREFIVCKDVDPQGIGSFNISVSWKDKFLKQVDFDHLESDSHVDSYTGLWHEQTKSAWKTGDPGMLFDDEINKYNATPHIGRINATNPCGETPNVNDEPCNLGSLGLRRFVMQRSDDGRKYEVDWAKLRHYVKLSTRYLDDVLDWNTFPHPDIDKMARLTRKLGLGVMGWADMLALLRIPYDTQDAVDLGSELWADCRRIAVEESIAMGKTKGVYPAWDASKSPDWAAASRNSTNTSIAPTGTIAIVSDNSPSIEPHYALESERTTYEGMKMQERIPVWKELNGFVPKVASEIGIEWHIKHQAAFQESTDLGVSKTINLPHNATVKDVSDAYRMMWKLKCKGGTIFRDGCRDEQVIVDTTKRTKSVYSTSDSAASALTEAQLKELVDKYAEQLHRYMVLPPGKTFETHPAGLSTRRKLPSRRMGITTKFRIGGTKGYYIVNKYDDGTPGELFVMIDNQGSTVDGFLVSWAKDFSVALQYGAALKDLVKLHKNSRFEPSGFTGDPELPNCTSIPDYIVRRIEKDFLKTEDAIMSKLDIGGLKSSQICPDCGSSLYHQAGCLVCFHPGCGFSKC